MEANRNRLIIGGGIIIVLIFLFSFFSWQREQKEIAAGEAITQLVLALPPDTSDSQLASSYLKIAREYPNTFAGRRAWLQGAAALFAADKYTDAQTQFQEFLEAHPDGEFTASAALGVAACFEALGKLDLAIGAYQRVVNGFSSQLAAATTARFALARIAGQQGKLDDALNYYESIARSNPNSPIAQKAAMYATELRVKTTRAKPSSAEP